MFTVSVFTVSVFSVPLTYLEIEQNIVADLIGPIRLKHGERYDGPQALVCHMFMLLIVSFRVFQVVSCRIAGFVNRVMAADV